MDITQAARKYRNSQLRLALGAASPAELESRLYFIVQGSDLPTNVRAADAYLRDQIVLAATRA